MKTIKNYKTIAIIGSTGSIGKTVLNVINNNKDKFKIILLTANENYKELLKQTKKFEVKNVIISNKIAFEKFKKLNRNSNINIFNDFKNINKIFKNKIDYLMSSIVGLKGLEPTLKTIKYTKTIALANKESIICGWNLIEKEIKKHKTKLIPVDSEHFSIWYSANSNSIDKVILTASGGPLLNMSKKKIENVKLKDVLNHPNWKMGSKITVDSSTLMNKVFEVIEARNIFNIKLKNISVLIHPNSYVHAIVSFNSGMIKIIAHETTMEIPIFNSIYQNNEKYSVKNKINIKKINNLNLKKVDTFKFPLVEILSLIPDKISLYETVIVSANDELVKMYLKGDIKYNEISLKLLNFVKNKKFVKFKKKIPKNISEIINLDNYVRLKLNSKDV